MAPIKFLMHRLRKCNAFLSVLKNFPLKAKYHFQLDVTRIIKSRVISWFFIIILSSTSNEGSERLDV